MVMSGQLGIHAGTMVSVPAEAQFDDDDVVM